MINTIDELRQSAVKYILRREAGAYLLRHSLGMPWESSQQLNEMAWTDYKKLYFNFPKLARSLQNYRDSTLNQHIPNNAQKATPTNTQAGPRTPLDPRDETIAMLAALAHEILHNLWLHRERGEGKMREAWDTSCEWAINHELAILFGMDWIKHLDVMYPPDKALQMLRARSLPPTTDGFYALFEEQKGGGGEGSGMLDEAKEHMRHGKCRHCDRRQRSSTQGKPKLDPDEMLRTIAGLPEGQEKADLVRYIYNLQAPSQKVPWEMLLLGGIEDAMQMEHSWAQPSRRNELLPGWRHEKLLSFVWVLDVSPSIDDDMKRSFVNTLQAGINLYHDAQHRVICFANGVMDDFVIDSGTSLAKWEIPCGSGTCLREVWEILEADRPEYALVLTDLELDEVPKPSVTQVVWGIVGNYRYFDPDYGVKIQLN